jgi:hypothetical protein
VCFSLNQPIHLVEQSLSLLGRQNIQSLQIVETVSFTFPFTLESWNMYQCVFHFFVVFNEKNLLYLYLLSCRFHFSNATTKHFFLSLSSSNSYSIDKHSHLSRIHFSHQSCLWVQEAVQSVFVVSQCVAFAERCLSVSPYSEQMFLCIQLE